MADHQFCTSCGARLDSGVAFCGDCGHRVADAGEQEPPPEVEPAVSEPSSPPSPETPPGYGPPPPYGPSPGYETPPPNVTPPGYGPPPGYWTPATPAYGPVPPYGAPPSPQRRSQQLWVVIALVVLLVAGGGSLTAYLLTRDDDEGTSPASEATAAAGEIFLEPAAAPGPDVFTASVDIDTAPTPVRLASAVTQPTPAPEPATAMRSVTGSAPGLYGGTRDNASCDAEQLIDFLQSDQGKATAWAAVLGIPTSQIRDYVEALTPLVLRADTRVTNHGYRNGVATPRQSVLEAGTAVLVDSNGIPRVRCACGNPLGPPQAQATGTHYQGGRWPGFSPPAVIVISSTTVVIEEFVVVDLLNPGFIIRPTGSPANGTPSDEPVLIDTFCDLFPQDCLPPSLPPPPTTAPVPPPATNPDEPVLGTGDVQVTLRWSSTADLDLAVTDPTGARISFGSPSAPSGGQLDVDSNAGCNGASTSPVENIFWPTGQSPEGTYTIEVSYWGECDGGSGPQPYELTVLVGGQPATVQPVAFPGGGADVAVHVVSDGGTLLAQAVTTGVLDAPGAVDTYEAARGALPPAEPEPQPEPETGSVRPAGPVEDLSALPETGGTYLTWLSNGAFETYGPPDGYVITIEPGGTTLAVPGAQLFQEVQGLEPGVEYEITVQAYNTGGTSEPVTVTVTPTGGPPEEQPSPAPPQAETLEEYCDRTYPPPPSTPAENPQWTLCMHDPTSPDAIEPGSLPIPIGN